jgi:2-amino-4-hydroxy-6-hydroxymethyldihydropteridine diphosphokinase
MATLALIALGSNKGDRRSHLQTAVAGLRGAPGIALRAISSYHETTPVGGPPGQGAFLNAAAAIETSLEPEPLLDVLRDLEARAGRSRTVHWGERTLDLDLLLFGDRRIQTPRLVVPHPRMAVRRFVLAPLAEIAPEVVDPLTGQDITSLLANLDRRPSVLVIDAPPSRGPWRTALYQAVLARLPSVGLSAPPDGSPQTVDAGVSGPPDLLSQPAPDDDRWLVSSDFVPHGPLNLPSPPGQKPPPPADSFGPLPTFIAAFPGGWFDHNTGPPAQIAPTTVVVVLRLESLDIGPACDEILAACAATRTVSQSVSTPDV